MAVYKNYQKKNLVGGDKKQIRFFSLFLQDDLSSQSCPVPDLPKKTSTLGVTKFMNKTEDVFTRVKTQAKTQAKCIGLIVFAVFGTSVNVALVLGYPLLNCLDVQLFRSLTNDATEW